jgi:dynein heavy chain
LCRHSAAEPHQQPLPEPWQQRLSGSFPQLLLIHLLREECFVPAAHAYVSQHLGREFTEPEPWTLDEVFEETTAKTPIVFILTTGKAHASTELAVCCCCPELC